MTASIIIIIAEGLQNVCNEMLKKDFSIRVKSVLKNLVKWLTKIDGEVLNRVKLYVVVLSWILGSKMFCFPLQLNNGLKMILPNRCLELHLQKGQLVFKM